MGDKDLEIADLIAEEIGSTPSAPDVSVELSDDPLGGKLRAMAVQIHAAANAFEVLGLERDADESDLRQAYTGLAKHLHPDGYVGASEEVLNLANELFDKIRAAWEVLSSEERRKKYCDHVMDGKPTEDEVTMETVRVYMDAEADFKRGLAAFHAGRISQAHKLFGSAVMAVPDEIEFEVYKSYTSFKIHHGTNPDRADAAFQKLKDALDANQNQERRLDGGWVLLGRAYRELDNPIAAKRCQVQALRFNPSNPDAIRELRRLDGRAPGGRGSKKKGFFGKLFGGKKK